MLGHVVQHTVCAREPSSTSIRDLGQSLGADSKPFKMGSTMSVTMQANQASPSGGGLKAVVSEPLPTPIEPEQFWAAVEETCLHRKALIFEKSYEGKTLPDGRFLCVSTFALSGVGNVPTYTVLQIDRAQNVCISRSFGTDSSLRCCITTSYLKLHTKPCCIEWWCDSHASRQAGPFVQTSFLDILGKMGSKAGTKPDQPSIFMPGKLSVVTEPITDCKVTAETFLDWSQQRLEKDKAEKQPDGGYLETVKSWILPTTYQLHYHDKSKNLIVTKDFGGDKSMDPRSLKSTSYSKPHTVNGKFIIEIWSETPELERLCGNAEKDAADHFLPTVLKTLAKASK